MGLYDTVLLACPECRCKLSIQSKAGDCELGNYHLSAVPMPIAHSLHGKSIYCSECNTSWVLHFGEIPLPTHIQGKLLKKEDI